MTTGYEPAFPLSALDGYTQYGMPLRDYFAAKAMESFVMAACTHEDAASAMGGPSVVASRAYVIADAMLKAREA